MGTKSRIELIVEAIASNGKTESKRAAWQYARSESAKAEAELIDVSNKTQNEIIASIGKMKPKDLANYNTKRVLDNVQKLLGQMIGDCEVIARRLVTANILAGKLKSIAKSYLFGERLIAAVSLSESDYARIERLTNEVIGRVQKGASLTMASVNTMIQNTAIRANMQPRVIEPQAGDELKKENELEPVEQEPMASDFSGEQVEKKKPKKTYKEIEPSKKELDDIRRNPVAYASRQSKSNVDYVQKLHNEYINGQNNNPIDTSAQREQSKKDLEGDAAGKAAFELEKNLRTKGLYAFVDQGGKRWSLASYCAMSVRTVSTQSTNLGEVFADEEHDLYYIVPHGGSCPLCAKYEGRVYSRSGKDKRYPSLASVFNKIDPNGSNDLDNTYLCIHPNCRHKIVKYVERSQTKSQREAMLKKSNRPFELSPHQEEVIRQNKERERVWNERTAAMREFQMYLQLLPANDVGGNFIKFYEHKQKNDSFYKGIKRKYEETLRNATNKK